MTKLRKIRITSEILDTFPAVMIGVVRAHKINNQGAQPKLQAELRQATELALQAVGSNPPSRHPRIACWREAYRSFGVKPKKYHSSIENLVRRVAKSGPPRSINKLVDLYNVVSLTHLMPVGGEDLDQIEGDLVLRYATESDSAALLLGESEPRRATPGEVIYCDSVGPVCRRWNWKEADRTKLTEETTSAVLVIEALPPVTRPDLEKALTHLTDLIARYCEGETRISILDAENPALQLPAQGT